MPSFSKQKGSSGIQLVHGYCANIFRMHHENVSLCFLRWASCQNGKCNTEWNWVKIIASWIIIVCISHHFQTIFIFLQMDFMGITETNGMRLRRAQRRLTIARYQTGYETSRKRDETKSVETVNDDQILPTIKKCEERKKNNKNKKWRWDMIEIT